MNQLRLWVGVLAVTCVAAGVGAGLLLARWVAPPPRVQAPGAFPDYERLLCDTFQLSPARHENLRVVLENYRTDVERIKDRYMADYMSSIELELRETGQRYSGLIRDKVLPEVRRAEYDRLCLGLPATPSH